jgi:hypothetical protein
MSCISFPSGIPTRLSAHQPQQQLAVRGRLTPGAVMKATIKTARLKSDHGKSPFSAVACLLLLLLAGMLVKFAAFSPIFHIANGN